MILGIISKQPSLTLLCVAVNKSMWHIALTFSAVGRDYSSYDSSILKLFLQPACRRGLLCLTFQLLSISSFRAFSSSSILCVCMMSYNYTFAITFVGTLM